MKKSVAYISDSYVLNIEGMKISCTDEVTLLRVTIGNWLSYNKEVLYKKE